MKDFNNDIAIVHLLDPQDIAGVDTTSLVLDTAQFDGAVIAVTVGALTGVDSSNYLTPILQESTTIADADFDAVDSADIYGAFTKIDASTEDSVTQYVGYAGTCRYIRVKLDFTDDGITASPVSVIGILGNADNLPVVDPAAITATIA